MKVGIGTMRVASLAAVLLFLLTFSTCGPGYHTTNINGVKKVYHVDDQGMKRLVYQVEKDGTTTVYDEEDPMYQKHLISKRFAEAASQEKADRIERIKQAKKRNPNDPIYVLLHPTEVGNSLEKAQLHKGAVFEHIRKEFKSDQIIKLVNKKDEKNNWRSKVRRSLSHAGVDVEVSTRSYLKETVGINKKTGKIGKMIAIVFEATITSDYIPGNYNVKESGHVLRNPEVTRRFANKVKRIIKHKVGPSIPADRTI
jgi:hypothetical protein